MEVTQHDIERYLAGKMTPAERHALEKKALSDPFLADALEGAESIAAKDFAADVAELEGRLRGEKKRRWLVPVRIAASVVGLVLLVAVVMWLGKQEPTTTEQAKAGETAGASDSLAAKPEAKPEETTVALADSKVESEKEKKPLGTLGPKTSGAGDNLAGAGGTGTSRSLKTDTIFNNALLASATVRDTVVLDIISADEEIAEAEITAPAKTETAPVATQRDEAARRNALPAPALIVTGQVRDAQGEPLPGANVNVKGASYGTVTDANGKYSIVISASQATLQYSFIGFVAQEVKVSTENAYTDVQLLEDATQLSEVVITTYGDKQTSDEPIVRLAEPVGGRKAYDQYLETKKVYPTQALENKVEGKVVVQFSVSTTGVIGNFQVLRKLGYGCDEEVIRLVKEGPAWRPSYIDNEAVESVVQVKTRFSLGKRKQR